MYIPQINPTVMQKAPKDIKKTHKLRHRYAGCKLVPKKNPSKNFDIQAPVNLCFLPGPPASQNTAYFVLS